jgi:integrase
MRRGKRRLLLDFRFTSTNGARARFRRDASVQNHAAAVAEAARLMKRAAATGKVIDDAPVIVKPKLIAIAFNAFFEDGFEKHFMPGFSEATRLRYRALHKQRVGAFFGAMPLDTIEPKHLREFAATLQRDGVQPKGAVNLVRTVLRAAHEHGLIETVPAMPKGLIKVNKKLPEAPSADEFRRMLEADGWLGVAIALAGFGGLRAGEVRAIEVRDVVFESEHIVVRHAMSEDALSTTKSGHERIVEMVPALAARLREAVTGKLPRARIVVDERGRTPRRQEVLYQFQRFLRKSGLKVRSFHSLRHFFISEMVRMGASVEAVRELAGHSSLAVTERYSHSSSRDRRDAVNKLSN